MSGFVGRPSVAPHNDHRSRRAACRAEQNGIGRTEQFTPVRLNEPPMPGMIVEVAIAGHDGRHLLAA